MKISGKIWITVLILALAMLAAQVSLVTEPTYAAGPWYVGPGGSDSNACTSPATRCATINGALNKAGFVAGDTIRVQVGTYTGSGNEVVLLDKDATLSGGWDAGFTTQTGMSTIDGESSRRGITVNSGVTATIERFVVQNGFFSQGGGTFNNGTLTLINSTIISNNSLGAFPQGTGGGIFNNYDSTLTMNNSTVINNMAGDEGGGIFNGGNLTMNNSTVSGNNADDNGGGINNDWVGTVILNNNAISGNTASSGGGISNAGTLTLNSNTVSSNTATDQWGGGGVRNLGTVTLQNTILAGNTAGNGPDCSITSGTIGSSGYNLIGNTSNCAFTLTTGDLTNIDPKLGPLEGSPAYHPLLSGSPAIDAGNPAGCTDHLGSPLTTDQRGVPRVNRCDIGAYEFAQSSSPSPNFVYLPIIIGRNCAVQFTDNFSNPGSGWPVQNTGNVLYEYLNGEYRILVKNGNSWFVGGPGVKVANFTMSVEVRNTTGVEGSYGLVFGGSDDVSQFYTFEIFPDSSYEIYRYNSGWTLLAGGSSGSINPGTATNRLRIERSGSLIKAYANDELLNILADGAFTGPRHVGLIASSYSQPNVDARFDNFTVCGGLTANTLTVTRKGMEATLSGYMAGSPGQIHK